MKGSRVALRTVTRISSARVDPSQTAPLPPPSSRLRIPMDSGYLKGGARGGGTCRYADAGNYYGVARGGRREGKVKRAGLKRVEALVPRGTPISQSRQRFSVRAHMRPAGFRVRDWLFSRSLYPELRRFSFVEMTAPILVIFKADLGNFGFVDFY